MSLGVNLFILSIMNGYCFFFPRDQLSQGLRGQVVEEIWCNFCKAEVNLSPSESLWNDKSSY